MRHVGSFRQGIDLRSPRWQITCPLVVDELGEAVTGKLHKVPGRVAEKGAGKSPCAGSLKKRFHHARVISGAGAARPGDGIRHGAPQRSGRPSTRRAGAEDTAPGRTRTRRDGRKLIEGVATCRHQGADWFRITEVEVLNGLVHQIHNPAGLSDASGIASRWQPREGRHDNATARRYEVRDDAPLRR